MNKRKNRMNGQTFELKKELFQMKQTVVNIIVILHMKKTYTKYFAGEIKPFLEMKKNVFCR